MAKNKLSKLVLVGFVCSLALVVYGTKKHKTATLSKPKEQFEKTLTKSKRPNLFFHGYKGSLISFGTMIHRLNRNELGTRSVTLTVSPQGEIKEDGNWSASDNPLIQVVFEDNTNQEWQQAEWIQQVLNYLRESYQTQEVNLIGHSMGGVSIMRYLANYGSQGSEVKINKVVTIGSPFNDFNEDERSYQEILAFGPTISAPRFVEYDNNFGNIPEEITFLSIAGDIEGDNGSDGTVPVASVVALNYLFEKYDLSYQFEKVQGKGAQHSALHENRKVDKLVAEFLWQN